MNASELYIFHVVGLALIAFSIGYCFKCTFCPDNVEIDMINSIETDIDRLENRVNRQEQVQRRLNLQYREFDGIRPVVATAIEPTAPPQQISPIHVEIMSPRENRSRPNTPRPNINSRQFIYNYSNSDIDEIASTSDESSPCRVRRVINSV
jgi:septal ring-binding cell division protein DamX